MSVANRKRAARNNSDLIPKEGVRMSLKENLLSAKDALEKMMGDFVPLISITLSSGLGYLVGLLEDPKSCPYSRIPNCPVPGATGHAGVLWWGRLNGVSVVMLQGRVHLYEGYSVEEVVFLTRLMIMMSAKRLILTHATGAVTHNLEPGDIVGVRSQIAFNCPDPTSGPGVPELGLEFSPVEAVFSPGLLKLAKRCALAQEVSFHRGVSAFKPGRTYESLAEIEYLARIGADVATMSTVPEVMAAAQMGAEVLDLALVTNMGAGLGAAASASHEEVLGAAEANKQPFGRLVVAIVKEMGPMK